MPIRVSAETNFLFRIALVMLFMAVFVQGIHTSYKAYAWLGLPLSLWFGWDLYRRMKKAQEEVQEFSQSIRYRDFSRNFNVRQAPDEVRTLREGFNEINTTLRVISREREMQFLYLQQILELVDIGILSYELESGKQNWMNQAFKKMFGIPYLRTLQTLRTRNEKLYLAIESIRPGQTQVFTVLSENRTVKVLMVASVFQTEGLTHKLVAFQNINRTLDENEAQAWQRLLSVMTHEIMNSVAPISSLSGSLKSRLEENEGPLPAADLEDLVLGLETIGRRSEGLLRFAQSYRNLNKPLTATIENYYLRDVFENLITLLQPSLDQKGIGLEVVLPDPKLQGQMDGSLIEQVLINLIANAADAVRDVEVKRISLLADQRDDRLFIRVSDNGSGIEPELLDRIFVPFFSTKKSGSGIGLSLCKQIMLLHRGTIQVYSEPGKGTAFDLEFP
jgi:signal transduction histidine kinase